MADFPAHEYLRQVQILKLLPNEAIEELALAVEWVRAEANQTIILRRDQNDCVYFVCEGRCRAQLATAVGQPVAFRRLRAGSHFGEIAALTAVARTVDVVTETPALIARCPGPAFESLMRKHAELAHAVAASLARTVVSLTQRVVELAKLDVRLRIYAELVRLALEEGVRTPEGIVVQDMPTHATIAATIKTHREAVTKELTSLTSEGVLEQNGRVLLLRDAPKLAEAVRRRLGEDNPENPEDDDDL